MAADVAVRSLTSREMDCKLADSAGVWLLGTASGGRL
jgi:hypothetical protein